MIESIKTLIVIVLFTSQLTSQNMLEFNVSINKHVSGTLLKSEKAKQSCDVRETSENYSAGIKS